MTTHQDAKQNLVDRLWLPLMTDAGEKLHPRRKKHKRMKLLTLTNHNRPEIISCVGANLVNFEDIVAWHPDSLEAIRITAVLGHAKVISDGKFEEIIFRINNSITPNLPCDIINLDFHSQGNNIGGEGRIERELHAGYAIAKSLADLETRGYLLIYTTLIDQQDISVDNLGFELNLPLGISNPAHSADEKNEFIREILCGAIKVNRYQISSFNELLIDIDARNKLLSIGCIVLKE